FTYVLACACSSFAALAVFVRFARKPHRVSDSLGANAYGIYLYYYACVSWLQYALLLANLPGIVKALIVFAGATSVSWIVSAALRSLPTAFGRMPQPAPQRG